MPSVQVDNQALFYAHHARGLAGGPAPALVLLHGAGGSHLDWPAALRRLAGISVLAPDLPGHGRSGGPGRDTAAGYAAAVAGLLRAAGVGPVVVAGHSLGGAVALALALAPADDPDRARLRGIILIGSGARLPVAPRLLALAETDFAAATAFIVRHSWDPRVPAAQRAQAQARLRLTPAPVLRQDLQACHGFDVRSRLAELSLPCLVVANPADRMTPLALSQEVADGLPAATLAVLAAGGHMMPLEQPAATVQAVISYWRRHWPAAAAPPANGRRR